MQDDPSYWTFSNIPYAEPPVGERRFARAVPITPERYQVRAFNNGSRTRICPQATVGWGQFAFPTFLLDRFARLDLRNWTRPIGTDQYGDVPELWPGMSEDCLTLDVFVPRSTWKKKDSIAGRKSPSCSSFPSHTPSAQPFTRPIYSLRIMV